MKAAVIRGTQQIQVEDVPTPEPGPIRFWSRSSTQQYVGRTFTDFSTE